MPNAESDLLMIRKCLSSWVNEVIFSNAVGYYDINRISEGTVLYLLNLVLELQLEDLNKVRINFPGIDLGDSIKGLVAFQVTSQSDSSKMLSSLEIFKENKCELTYPSGLRFFILNNKRKARVRSKKFELYASIFNLKTDILYVSDLEPLIKNIYYNDQQRFLKIRDFLQREFGTGYSDGDSTKRLIHFNTSAEKLAFYRRVFAGTYQNLKEVFIPFVCKVEDVVHGTDLVQKMIYTQIGAVIIGPSGCGKSIFAKHAALSFLEQGIPVILNGKYYEDSLNDLCDKEVNAMGFNSANDLFNAAIELKLPLLILIDGFNECHPDKKAILLTELETLQSLYEVKIILTDQVNDQRFACLNLLSVQIDYPSSETKKAIANSYSGRLLSSKFDSLLSVISTSLEAKMAGEIGNEEIDGLSKFVLFEAFINLKLGSARKEGFLLLSNLAKMLSDKIAFSISQRDLDALLTKHKISETIYKSCLEAKILEQSLGKISFGHELFLNFFIAESIVRFASDLSVIVNEMNAPKNYDKTLLILGSITDQITLNHVLANITDVNLLNLISVGEAGDYCKEWIRREVAILMRLVEQEIHQLEYRVDDQSSSNVSFVKGTLIEWNEQQKAKIVLLSYLLNRGQLLPEFFDLIAQMDDKIDDAIEALWDEGQQKNISVRHGTFAASYVGFSKYNSAITSVFSNLHSGFVTFNNSLAVSDKMLQQLLEKRVTRGQLYFLLTLLRWDEKVKYLYPNAIDILKNKWKITPYHLRNAVLDKIPYMYDTEEQRKELIEILNEINSLTNDIWLSTSIFDALGALGALDEDATEHFSVVSLEINKILEEPSLESNFNHAIRIYNCQFDHPYNSAYQDAIGELTLEKKEIFIEMALKGLDSPFFASILLKEGVKLLGKRICPLIVKWTEKPVVEKTFPQDSLRLFLLSHLILARYNNPLKSRFLETESKSNQSLLAAAELYYWLNRTDLDSSQINNESKNAQATLFSYKNVYLIATVSECRHTLAQAGMMHLFTESSITMIDDYFCDNIVVAARNTILNPSSQLKIESVSFDHDVMQQAIHLVKSYGTLLDIDVLRSLSEHPKYGQSAVQAIKDLSQKTQ